jgi:hypothetical protein
VTHKAVVVVALLLISCAAMQETAVRSPLKVYEYNSIARKYMDRPTSVAVDGSPGSQRLKVFFPTVSQSQATTRCSQLSTQIPIWSI